MSEAVLTPAQTAQEAQAAYQRGEFREAAHLFQVAADGYALAGDSLMSAEMKNNISVSLLQAKDAQGALAAADAALAVFSQANERRNLALASGNRAAALEALRRIDDALAAYEQCAEILKELGEYDLRMYVMQSISKIYTRKGRPLEALAAMRAGVNNLPHPTLRQRVLKNLLDYPFKLMQK